MEIFQAHGSVKSDRPQLQVDACRKMPDQLKISGLLALRQKHFFLRYLEQAVLNPHFSGLNVAHRRASFVASLPGLDQRFFRLSKSSRLVQIKEARKNGRSGANGDLPVFSRNGFNGSGRDLV